MLCFFKVFKALPSPWWLNRASCRIGLTGQRGRGISLCFLVESEFYRLRVWRIGLGSNSVFLVESEFHRLRFCCNPSSVRERPRQQLCFSLRETVSTLKRSPVLILLMWPGAGVDGSQLMRLIKILYNFAAFCSFGELHAFVNAVQTPEKLPKKISKRQPLFCTGKFKLGSS